MTRTRLVVTVALFALISLLAACGEEPQVVESTRDTPTTAAPESGGESHLPPDHPPIDGSGQGGVAIPPPPPGAGQASSALVWDVPASWSEQTPSSSMRRAQYVVSGPAGDAECVVFYFGPGQGGDPMANALRWAKQFSQPDGSSPEEAMTTSTYTSTAGVDVTQVEVTGTYGGGMMMGSPDEGAQENAMLLGSIAEGPDAPWFFKMTGPQETVEANRDAFETMMKSLRRGSDEA